MLSLIRRKGSQKKKVKMKMTQKKKAMMMKNSQKFNRGC